jgi:hypothetical protein
MLFVAISTIAGKNSDENESAKPNKKQILSMLHQIKEMPYLELSGDSLYWALAKEGLEIVPDLIDLIDNGKVTQMTAYNIPYNYTIGDISIHILDEIIHGMFGISEDIIKKHKDYKRIRNHCTDVGSAWVDYFCFVNLYKKNRIYLKKELHSWFAENKEKLIWVEHKQEFSRSNFSWKADNYYNGAYHYPTRGYYKLKDDSHSY